MQQLKCRDLKSGDLLLKLNDGSFTSNIISFGQTGLLNPKVIHAGIMFDNNIIIEASGPGVIANDLRIQDKKYGYIVYRPTNPAIAAGAGTCAKLLFDIQHKHKTIKYNLIGTVMTRIGSSGTAKSPEQMDKLLDDVLAGKNSPMFCSQFVVFVFQFVAEQNGQAGSTIFNISDAKASPSRLASILQSNSSFKEAGYMMPNER